MNAIIGTWHGRVVATLLIAALFWALGVPGLLNRADAAALSSYSVTLSDSDLSVTANHAFAFTTANALDADDVIEILWDTDTQLFVVDSGSLVAGDFSSESGLDVVAACGGGSDEATITFADATSTYLTVCTGDTITAGAKTFTVGNSRITNPGVAASYVIRVNTRDEATAGTVIDTADTRVAILDDVTVTASVNTSFTFTVAGVASGNQVNGDNTTISTTNTTIPFGTLTDIDTDPTASTTGAHDLTVATNAANGFTVTVEADQALTSGTGGTIDFFADGGEDAAPAGWADPSDNIADTDTWGHWGVTSEDDLNASEFGSRQYVGNFNATPRAIFNHTGPADGSTADIGATRVGYKVAITALQEAGTDYTATLTYIATPVF